MLRFSILPVLAVAGATPEEHHVKICDENVEPLNIDQDVDLVGISVMTATANRGREIAGIFRNRGKTVVAGGYHATLAGDDLLSDFDAVVIGDAENTWPEVIKDFESGCLKKIYKCESLVDMSTVPIPRRDIIQRNAASYATLNAVQIGRGCRHGCRYCSITAFHRQTYRCRPVDQVIEELRQLSRDIIFVDDNIIADPAYSKRLFQEMIPLKKRWVSQAAITIADDPELLKLAYQSGCRGLFIGVETINEQNLNSVEKKFNRAPDYQSRISMIRRNGIGIIAGIIVGMDNDDVTVFEKTLRFLQKTGIDAIQLNIMTPLPGTPLHRELKAAGRISDTNYDHYDFRHCVIRPLGMSSLELQDGADWLYHQFYRLDRILIRTLRSFLKAGLYPGLLTWRLNMTYRYDNRREKIIGRNPAKATDRKFRRYLAPPPRPTSTPPSPAPMRLGHQLKKAWLR